MKYSRPTKNSTRNSLTQGFHQGHQANDFGGFYGEFICAPFNAKVINVVTSDKLDGNDNLLRNGAGVRLQSIEDPSITISYWHCLGVFPVAKGDYVDQGAVIAQMGNSGFVLSNGVVVEVDQKLIPPYRGTHVHITMGKNNPDGTYTPMDYQAQIDWLIPVTYDLKTAIMAVLQRISNIINNK